MQRTFWDTAWGSFGRLLLIWTVIGLVAGLGAVGFFVMLDAAKELFLGYLANYRSPAPGLESSLFEFGTWTQEQHLVRWMLLILPAVGGLISGLIVFTWAPEAEGHGTDAAIEAYHLRDGAVRARVPLIKAVTSALVIGTGGSAGREGPIAQIGSGFGSILGRWLKVPAQERRVYMAAGMAAGIGAIFHAPLAGALFAAEVMYRGPDFEHEILVPGFVSSIVAYSVFGWIFGFHPLFATPAYDFGNPLLLLPYAILALTVSLGAALYVRCFYAWRHVMFHRISRIPNHLKPALGGLLVGVIGFFLPETLATGYGVVQRCFNSDTGQGADLSSLPSMETLQTMLPAGMDSLWVTAALLAVLALGKILTTAFTVGSGGSGGVFGPAVAIGGMIGGATGLVCQQLLPSLHVQPGAFALVGMAGFFAGAANTPVSTIIMISEMTGNYNLLLPSMLVCILAFLLCRRVNLYQKQLESRLHAPSKLGNMVGAVLSRMTVAQALSTRRDTPLITVRGEDGFENLSRRFALSSQNCFPVLDDQGRLTAVIDGRDIRRIIAEQGLGQLIIAADIQRPPVTVKLNESLLTAMSTMLRVNSVELLVVSEDDSQRVLGVLSRGDVFAAYDRHIVEAGISPILSTADSTP